MSEEQKEQNSGEGIRVKRAIAAFYEDRTTDSLVTAMAVLSDSLVWIPCREQAGEEVRLEPEIVQNNKGYFFPVFTSREEMSAYGEKVSRVQELFSEAIVLARNNPSYEIAGIVVNAFTQPFTLSWDLLEMIEKSTEN